MTTINYVKRSGYHPSKTSNLEKRLLMETSLALTSIEKFVYSHFIVYSDPRPEALMLWNKELWDCEIDESGSFGLDTLEYNEAVFHHFEDVWMVRGGVVRKWTDPFKENRYTVSAFRSKHSAILTLLGLYPLTTGPNSSVDSFIEKTNMYGAARFRTWYTFSPEAVAFMLLTGKTRASQMYRKMMLLDAPNKPRSISSVNNFLIAQLDA